MLFGIMNHPALAIADEIRWAHDHGFDFLDLTFEPPASRQKGLSAKTIRSQLKQYGLQAMGHTAWHLPFASPYASVRKAVLAEMIKSAQWLHQVGAPSINVHVMARSVAHYIPLSETIDCYSEILSGLKTKCDRLGMGVMLEHINNHDRQFEILDGIYRQVPGLYFHLDAGHANLGPGASRIGLFLKKYGNQLAHVHISDNFGDDDSHLPLGAGNIDWTEVCRLLRKHGYDKTMTLEVFSRDRHYVTYGLEKIKAIWAGV